MPRYQVNIEVTSVEVTTVYVDADSPGEAEEKAQLLVDEDWPDDFEQVDCSLDFVASLLDPEHYVSPISFGKDTVTRCKSCDKPVRWTGKHVPGERTIPGPWVHEEE